MNRSNNFPESQEWSESVLADDCSRLWFARFNVAGVKLRRDKIVVALENKVYVYNFADLQLINQIETTANPKGRVLLMIIELLQ